MAKTVMTVLGPIAPEELGITMVHEHLILDSANIWHEPEEPFKKKLMNEPVKMENLWLLLRDGTASKDNLRLDNPDMISEDISSYQRLGGKSVVELTHATLGRDPIGLKQISRKTGVHIICSCGYYVEHTHPKNLAEKSVRDIATEFVKEIEDGIANTGIRPGVIGEIGTSAPVTKQEEKVLRAAAQAHIETKVPINVHLSHPRNQGHRVLDILEEEEVEPDRVALSHLDQVLTPEALKDHRSLAERGAYIEYDDFGEEHYLYQWATPNRIAVTILPRDIERVDAVSKLIDMGCLDKLMLSSDLCEKIQLGHYGGFGYQHILRDILPLMKGRGIGKKEVDTMLVKNPARFLPC